MNTFRTTINLDQTLHRQLSVRAAALGVSLSHLVNRLLSNTNALRQSGAAADLDNDLNLFRHLAQKSGRTDWVKVLREERNRDHD